MRNLGFPDVVVVVVVVVVLVVVVMPSVMWSYSRTPIECCTTLSCTAMYCTVLYWDRSPC